jgi:hypothetical protein
LTRSTTITARIPRIATGLALAVAIAIALGGLAGAAYADDHHDRGRGGDRHGYYGAPPVVYGSPYYYPPPVVYGPGIGINLPGVAIGIR